MVPRPADYRWSSYRAFIGEIKGPEWLEMSLLTAFGNRQKQAKKNYQRFVEEIDPAAFGNHKDSLVAGFILGKQGGVSWVQKQFLSSTGHDREIPHAAQKLQPSISLDSITELVCAEMNCTPEDLLSKGRKKNQAREIAIYLARMLSGLSCSTLGSISAGRQGRLSPCATINSLRNYPGRRD